MDAAQAAKLAGLLAEHGGGSFSAEPVRAIVADGVSAGQRSRLDELVSVCERLEGMAVQSATNASKQARAQQQQARATEWRCGDARSAGGNHFCALFFSDSVAHTGTGTGSGTVVVYYGIAVLWYCGTVDCVLVLVYCDNTFPPDARIQYIGFLHFLEGPV